MAEGGCFCGAIRYKNEGQPVIKGLCHCRQCQYFAGGGSNHFLAVPTDGFTYTKGEPKIYERSNAPVLPAAREFCSECGTQIVTRSSAMPEVIFLKVGTLDDPAAYGAFNVAIFTSDKQPFHHVAEGVKSFDKLPPM